MIVEKEGMAWIGKIVATAPIPGADKIKRADVICGAGGKWSGVVAVEIPIESDVVVFLPDSIVPDHPNLEFMKKHKHRVKMMRLKGCPSEVLIMPYEAFFINPNKEIGLDVTNLLGVKKYEKEPPPDIGGRPAGAFPLFVPKTDELNFQKVPEFRDALVGNEFYSTVKYDGTSHTVYHNAGQFGACSRNWEIQENENSVIWKLIEKYELKYLLPLLGNIAVQWECIGPSIQSNPLGLSEIEIRVFNAYDIDTKEYVSLPALINTANFLNLPMAEIEREGIYHDMPDDELRDWAKGTYPNGNQREGIVIRPKNPMRVGQQRLSFKVINLDYKEA